MATVLPRLSCTHCLASSRTSDAPLGAKADGRLSPELPALLALMPVAAGASALTRLIAATLVLVAVVNWDLRRR